MNGNFKTQNAKILSQDNIMSQRLPHYIRFKNNIDIAENSKRKLRKTFNLSFKGIKGKKKQNKIVMDYAKELRGSGKRFRSLKHAYRYLAQDYNLSIEKERETILVGRKLRKDLEKQLINFKLGKTGSITINKKTIDALDMVNVVRIIMSIMGGEMVLLKANFTMINEDNDIDEEDKFFTLNQGNVSNLITALTATEIQKTEYDGSDEEWVGLIQKANSITLSYPKFDKKDFDKSGNLKTKKGGAFFKYINMTNFDLSGSGIFPEVLPDNYKNNCLYNALEAGGLEDEKLQLLKTFVVNRDVPMSKLKKICEKLHITIRLRKNDLTDKALVYGKGHTDVFNIGLIDRHYFLIQKVDFTMFALKNYFTLNAKYEGDVEKYKYIYKKRGKNYKKDKNRITDTFKVIKYMLENKERYLRPISLDSGILETQFFDRAFDFDNLEYDEEECCRENMVRYNKDGDLIDQVELEAYKTRRAKEWKKWYFDTESYKHRTVDKEIEERIKEAIRKRDKPLYLKLKKRIYKYIHRPYMACAISDEGEKLCAYGDGCCKLLLQHILKYTEARPSGEESGKFSPFTNSMDIVCKKALLIAHNCNYDYRFFQKYIYAIDQKTKGSGLMNATARFTDYVKGKPQHLRLQFKDSLKLIASPLRNFGKMFNLKQEKEIFPYGLYNRVNLKENIIEIRRAKHYLSPEDYKGFCKNLKRLGLTYNVDGKKMFNMMKYAEYYCMMDCKVLQGGYETFRGWVLEQIDIDVDSVWTVASLADKYMKLNGVYNGVFELAGVPQLFIQKCVVGGRTMMRDNVKWNFDATDKNSDCYGKKMADYDGVSLYPSSMYRMEGCLMGMPKILNDKQKTMNFLKTVDGYFIKVKITKVGIKRHFSLMSEVNENLVRVFHNDMVGKTLYLDRTSVEDLIKFQDVEFDIDCGYYYDEGRNPTIRAVIKKIFDLRLALKKQKNDAQMIYKLIMNSSYGKTILKPINTEEQIISTKDKDEFIRNNYNYIIEFEKMFESEKWRFKLHKTINEHFNNCVVGVEVLSMSKRIMNEVMCLCEDNDLTAYYQDTDSIHMEWDDVKVLKEKFKEQYGRELDGKQLGQFHIDFDLYDDDGTECENVYAEKSIFLGKKCYIDCLVGDNGNKKVKGFHIRMKGVPNSTIKYTAKKMGIGLDKLYEMLYKGKELVFDLLEGGRRCNFKFHNNGSVSSMMDFSRKIKF